MYQADISGIVAGLKIETNKIGYVAAVGIPEDSESCSHSK